MVINRDTTVLAQALDTVGDLAAKALALELWSKLRVKHHSSRALRFAAPVSVSFNLRAELLDNLKHASSYLIAIHINTAITEIGFDLIVCQLGQCFLELLVECFLECLSHEFVVRLNSVLNETVLIINEFKLNAIDLILDVVLKLGIACKHVLICIDQA